MHRPSSVVTALISGGVSLLAGAHGLAESAAPSTAYNPSDDALVFCRGPIATHLGFSGDADEGLIYTIDAAFAASGVNGANLSSGQCGKIQARPSQSRYHYSFTLRLNPDITTYAVSYASYMTTCLTNPAMMLVFNETYGGAARLYCVPWEARPARTLRAR